MCLKIKISKNEEQATLQFEKEARLLMEFDFFYSQKVKVKVALSNFFKISFQDPKS